MSNNIIVYSLTLVMLLLTAKPRMFLYAYLSYFFIFYLVQYSIGGVDAVLAGISIGEGVTSNFIMVMILLLWSSGYIVMTGYRKASSGMGFYEQPGSILIAIFGIIVVIALSVQIVSSEEPVSLLLRKGRDNISYPILLYMMWKVFNREGDEIRILNFLLIWFVIIIVIGLVFNVGEAALSRGGEGFSRISGIYFGANNTAAFLVIFIPFVYAKIKQGAAVSKTIWNIVMAVSLVLVVMTWTRAALIALAFAYIIWLWIEGLGVKTVLTLLAMLVLFILSWGILHSLFVEDISSGKSTFTGRINYIWLPVINYMFERWDTYILWFGSPVRSINVLVGEITDRTMAGHNITLSYLVTYGIFSSLLIVAFYATVALAGIKACKMRGIEKQYKYILMGATLSVITFFIMSHSASTDSIYYWNIIVPVVYILWKARRAAIDA